MSIKLMAKVWECQVTHREQALLLALCDHADDNGRNVFPSVAYLEWKTDFDERTIQRTMSDLRERGILIVERKAGYKRPTNYRINLDALPRKKPYERKGDRLSPYIQYAEDEPDTAKGDNVTPNDDAPQPEGVTESSPKGDNSPEVGDKKAEKGDVAVSHESSLNDQTTSNESSEEEMSAKTIIQAELNSLFHIPPDFDWAWLDPLLVEFPDAQMHVEYARYLFNLKSPRRGLIVMIPSPSEFKTGLSYWKVRRPLKTREAVPT